MSFEFHFFLKSDLEHPRLLHFNNGSFSFFLKKSKAHDINQDGLGIISQHNQGRIFFITDGMGGHLCGEEASKLVAMGFKEVLKGISNEKSINWREVILDALERADKKIKDLKVGAGSTVVAFEIGDQAARLYHAGDSTGFITGGRGRLKYKTIEHSPLGYGIESGILEDGVAQKLVEEHIVSNGLGFEDMRVEVGQSIELNPNDVLFACTDGLSKCLPFDDLSDLVISDDFENRSQNILNAISKSKDFLEDDTSFGLWKMKDLV